MSRLEIPIHSIVLLVGPTQSGKTTWANNFQKIIFENYNGIRCSIVSSDEIRKKLVGENLDRNDHRMLAVSKQAFDLLESEVKALISYPVNTEIVVIDTTGIDEGFREKMVNIAKENAYSTVVVSFDYQTSEYFKNLSKTTSKDVVSRQVNKFKKLTLPVLTRKHYNVCFSVKSKDRKFFEELNVCLTKFDLWKRCILDSNKKTVFIGDVHESVEALSSLVKKFEEDEQIVLLGDYIDKGNNTKEIIELVSDLVANGAKVLVANHESFVARRLLGEISKNEEEDVLFPSLSVLRNDKDLAQKFLSVFEKSIPFAFFSNKNVMVYATHAPCRNKYIGKLDLFSMKSQRNFYFKGRSLKDMSNDLSFVLEEADRTHPFHVFGHVAHNGKIIDKNNVWLDTGAVYGNGLSAISFEPSGKHKIVSVNSVCLDFSKDELFSFVDWDKKENNIEKSGVESEANYKKKEKYNLDEKERFWLKDFLNSGACFIAGTMAPSASTKNELEPFNGAIEYYKSRGVDKVSIQPKLMGSRVQLYLFENKNEDFFITRSGHRPKMNQEMISIIDSWREKTKKQYQWKNHIILDGELMPWSFIGQGLIDREFAIYGNAFLRENCILAEDSVFSSLEQFCTRNNDWHVTHSEIFMNQIEIYGKTENPYYVPFNVLKIDDVIYPFSSHDVFSELNSGMPIFTVNLNDAESVNNGYEFFKKLTEGSFKFEGVVVKPYDDRNIFNLAPYMKVRNENYLHIIYGYDYQQKYDKMCAQKQIGRKLGLSISEYNIGKKMLSANKEQLEELVCSMMFELKQEEKIDVRL